MKVQLKPLEDNDKVQFIRDNQRAFNYGALEEFGQRSCTFEEDDQVISAKTIEQSINTGIAYRIICDGNVSGGVVVKVSEDQGFLDLLFVEPKEHSKGIGRAAFMEIERMYPAVRVWQTHTPYFEKRNIHFYVNCLGFHIVEYFCNKHRDPHSCSDENLNYDEDMFRFEKIIGN